MADGKRYANHRKALLQMFLVSKKTKWKGEKPHTKIEMPPKFQPAVHPPLTFARFCETPISSLLINGWHYVVPENIHTSTMGGYCESQGGRVGEGVS